jgi:hypothetical protein
LNHRADSRGRRQATSSRRNEVSLLNAIATRSRGSADAIGSSLPQLLSRVFPPKAGGTLPALVAMANHTDRRSAVYPETANHLLNPLEGDDSEIFEIDRSSLVLQLRTLHRAIDESAEEMQMVADEAVFAKSVSKALSRTARKLSRVSEDLSVLHKMIQQARPPTVPGRVTRQPASRNGRQTL